jgi:hypothetical protein
VSLAGERSVDLPTARKSDAASGKVNPLALTPFRLQFLILRLIDLPLANFSGSSKRRKPVRLQSVLRTG